MAVTNALAYNIMATIGAVKKFYNIGSTGLYYNTYYGRNVRIFRNKLECLSLSSLSSQVYYLWAMPGAYCRLKHMKGSCFTNKH